MTDARKPAPATEPAPVIKDDQPRTYFDCNKCPAFCCSVYERVRVTKRDVTRLAKHFGVSYDVAWRRYTREVEGERVLKRVKDYVFEETCMFLDQHTRRCTIYHARPGTCREYPDRARCAYYDLLQFERAQQGKDTVVPIIQLSFREVERIEVDGEDGREKRWAWGDEE